MVYCEPKSSSKSSANASSEVAQQSKARGKDDFLIAFSPVSCDLHAPVAQRRLIRIQIIAEATTVAYKGAANDIQQKLRRVLEVWRHRNVFEGPILDAVEARVNGRPRLLS